MDGQVYYPTESSYDFGVFVDFSSEGLHEVQVRNGKTDKQGGLVLHLKRDWSISRKRWWHLRSSWAFCLSFQVQSHAKGARNIVATPMEFSVTPWTRRWREILSKSCDCAKWKVLEESTLTMESCNGNCSISFVRFETLRGFWLLHSPDTLFFSNLMSSSDDGDLPPLTESAMLTRNPSKLLVFVCLFSCVHSYVCMGVCVSYVFEGNKLREKERERERERERGREGKRERKRERVSAWERGWERETRRISKKFSRVLFPSCSDQRNNCQGTSAILSKYCFASSFHSF